MEEPMSCGGKLRTHELREKRGLSCGEAWRWWKKFGKNPKEGRLLGLPRPNQRKGGAFLQRREGGTPGPVAESLLVDDSKDRRSAGWEVQRTEERRKRRVFSRRSAATQRQKGNIGTRSEVRGRTLHRGLRSRLRKKSGPRGPRGTTRRRGGIGGPSKVIGRTRSREAGERVERQGGGRPQTIRMPKKERVPWRA